MLNIICGVDPDSKAHGVAIYVNGNLKELHTIPLMQLMGKLVGLQGNLGATITVHIENVRANNKTFKKKGVKNALAGTAVTRGLGMCQQSQAEVERLCEYLGIPVVHHKISEQWKSPTRGKPIFERITGWNKRSNEENRSAAYFGYLGVTSK